jgi:hypothetical protein
MNQLDVGSWISTNCAIRSWFPAGMSAVGNIGLCPGGCPVALATLMLAMYMEQCHSNGRRLRRNLARTVHDLAMRGLLTDMLSSLAGDIGIAQLWQ